MAHTQGTGALLTPAIQEHMSVGAGFGRPGTAHPELPVPLLPGAVAFILPNQNYSAEG